MNEHHNFFHSKACLISTEMETVWAFSWEQTRQTRPEERVLWICSYEKIVEVHSMSKRQNFLLEKPHTISTEMKTVQDFSREQTRKVFSEEKTHWIVSKEKIH